MNTEKPAGKESTDSALIVELTERAKRVEAEYLNLLENKLLKVPKPCGDAGSRWEAEQLSVTPMTAKGLWWGSCFVLPEALAEQIKTGSPGPLIWTYVHEILLAAGQAAPSSWGGVSALCHVSLAVLFAEVGETWVAVGNGRHLWSARFLALALPADFIGLHIARQFQHKRADAAKLLASPAERDAALRSARSMIRKAKGVFSEKNRLLLERLKMPITESMKRFVGAATIHVGPPRHPAPTIAQFTLLLETMARLERENAPVYLLLLLVYWCGLRAQETRAARVSWLIDSLETPQVFLCHEEGFSPKSRRNRPITFPAWVLGRCQHLTGSREYVISDDKAVRARAYQSALELLKTIGIEDAKPLHGGRRVYVTAMERSMGLEATATSTGHASMNVTMTCYFLEDIEDAFIELWEKGPDAFRAKLPPAEPES